MKALLILFLLLSPSVEGAILDKMERGPFAAHVSYAPQELRLDDQLNIELKLIYPKGFRPAYEKIRANITEPNLFGIMPFFITQEEHALKEDNQTVTETISYVLKPLYAGDFALRIAPLDFIAKESQERFYPSILFIRVNAEPSLAKAPPLPQLLPLEPGDPLEIRPDLLAKIKSHDYAKENIQLFSAHSFPWAGVLGTLIFMGGLPFALRALQKYQKQSRPKSPQRPFNLLIAEINRLQFETPQTTDAGRQAVEQLTSATRQIFDQLFGISSLSLTYEEIMPFLFSHKDISATLLEKIRDLFTSLEELAYKSSSQVEKVRDAAKTAQEIIAEIIDQKSIK